MIKRNLLIKLREHLLQKEITLVVGPRQAGKTTILKVLQGELQEQGKKTFFLNLDIEVDNQFVKTQEHLLRKLQLEFGEKEGYVFIDEIQRKENAGLFLKGLYDMDLPYKFILSGSGSVELKEKIHESLAGRKRIFQLNTVTFEEFVQYKTLYHYGERLDEYFQIHEQQPLSLLEEYLNFGGYPRVVIDNAEREKKNTLHEIYQSYVEKDILALLNIRNTAGFSQLVKLISANIGGPINISEIASALRLSQSTVQNYLWYLEKTFMIHKVPPYFKNKRKEITKMPVLYFGDLGIRNNILGITGNALLDTTRGFIFQNFVFRILKEKIDEENGEIHFWRTRDGAEVDFILVRGTESIPVEVKYSKLTGPEMSRSFRSFFQTYRPQYGIIVNLSLERQENLNGGKVIFLPYHKLITSSPFLDQR